MIRSALCDIILWSIKTDEVDGIRIADLGQPEHGFARHMRAALELIHQVDPRRYRRAKRLRWIVKRASSYGAGWGEYIHSTRSCAIDFQLYEGTSDDVLASIYASLIVHESTHCLLTERGCRYEGPDRARHERICVREENRFCSRLEAARPGSAERMISEFDPSKWDQAWNMSKLDHLKAA